MWCSLRGTRALPAQRYQGDVPEPDCEVDLVVDHVDAKDAEGVEALQTPTGAKPVEGALGQTGEDLPEKR